MASEVIYERYLWFHSRVRAGRYPNARTLAERFEIAHKTAQRNIELMRNRLFAPLEYVHERRGYAYGDDTYELPGLWLSDEELISLLVSYRVASLIPDNALKGSMKAFLQQVLTLLGSAQKVSLHVLNEKVSVKNVAYSRATGRTFHQVLDHLLKARPMKIEYYSPHTDEATTRDIAPLHLLHYMGTWHLVAHCALRGELRYFTLSRIRSIRNTTLAINPGVTSASLKDYLRRNFGILNSDEAIEVCLRFSPKTAPWVAEQVWHPRQVARTDPDGSLFLSFPVADFREIKREILKFGSQVEVVAPAVLKEEVKAEIEKMWSLYHEN